MSDSWICLFPRSGLTDCFSWCHPCICFLKEDIVDWCWPDSWQSFCGFRGLCCFEPCVYVRTPVPTMKQEIWQSLQTGQARHRVHTCQVSLNKLKCCTFLYHDCSTRSSNFINLNIIYRERGTKENTCLRVRDWTQKSQRHQTMDFLGWL